MSAEQLDSSANISGEISSDSNSKSHLADSVEIYRVIISRLKNIITWTMQLETVISNIGNAQRYVVARECDMAGIPPPASGMIARLFTNENILRNTWHIGKVDFDTLFAANYEYNRRMGTNYQIILRYL